MDLRATGAIDVCRVNEERTVRANVREAIFLLRGYQLRLGFCLKESCGMKLVTQQKHFRTFCSEFFILISTGIGTLSAPPPRRHGLKS